MKHYCKSALSILVLLLFASCENRYRKNVASYPVNSDISTEAPVGKQKVDIAKDAYQVSADEYDEFFATRYGLLYQKFSDTPFTGQIVTVENSPKGKFVIADESWRNGKKDGPSIRWFSNGVKMYERNYSDGKWNGTVTRWWPNGQKMYVRAYSDGVKHGEEATWRSDGTPIKTAAKLSEVAPNAVIENDQGETMNSDSGLTPVEFEEPLNEMADSLSGEPSEPNPNFDAVLEDSAQSQEQSLSADSFPSDLPGIPEQLALPEPKVSPAAISPELPTLPDADFEADEASMPSRVEAEPFPDLPESPAPEAAATELPGLPGIEPEPMDITDTDFPDLPGFPADSAGLPPMSVEDDALPGLPPLPGSVDGSASDLPPLPPLP